MRHDIFEKILNRRIKLTKSVLPTKNKEYASDSDKLHNFKRAGAMLGCTPEKALIGMWTKHIISILDKVDEIEYKCNSESDCFPVFEDDTEEYIETIEEKIGDAINYLILLEALIKERYKK
jgi:hypothetical protein